MKIMQMALLKHAAHHREREAQEQYRDQQRVAPAGATFTSAAMHRELADEYERLAEQYEEASAPVSIKPIRVMLDGVEIESRKWEKCDQDGIDMYVFDAQGRQMWLNNGLPVIERRTGKVEIIGRDVDPDALGGVAS